MLKNYLKYKKIELKQYLQIMRTKKTSLKKQQHTALLLEKQEKSNRNTIAKEK